MVAFGCRLMCRIIRKEGLLFSDFKIDGLKHFRMIVERVRLTIHEVIKTIIDIEHGNLILVYLKNRVFVLIRRLFDYQFHPINYFLLNYVLVFILVLRLFTFFIRIIVPIHLFKLFYVLIESGSFNTLFMLSSPYVLDI